MGLESFMQRATCISQSLSACQPDEAAHQPAASTSSPPVPEPMQLDSTRLTRAKHARHLEAGLCLYCAAPGHFINACRVRPTCPTVSTLQLEPEIATLSLLPVQLLTPDCSVSVSTPVDSGSSGNFISKDPLSHLRLPHQCQAQELRVETIQGKPLWRGQVNYRTLLMKLRVGCLHEETITFLVLDGSPVDIIQGHPWLTLQKSEGNHVR